MKNPKEYAKLEKDYAAMERNRKRYIFLFAILASVALGFSIYFLIEYLNDKYSIFVFLSMMLITLLCIYFMCLYIYRMFIVPNKLPLQKNMYDEYKNKKVRQSFKKIGLIDKKVDCFLDPHGFIVVTYDIDDVVITKMKVGYRTFDISLNLNDRFYDLDKKIFDKNLKGKYNKLSSYKNKNYDLDGLYNEFKKYIDDNKDKINVLKESALIAKKEHEQMFGGSI